MRYNTYQSLLQKAVIRLRNLLLLVWTNRFVEALFSCATCADARLLALFRMEKN